MSDETAPPSPGPNTLRLQALRGVLLPLPREDATQAVTAAPAAVSPGPGGAVAVSADPLWSGAHLARLLNSLLGTLMDADDAARARDLTTLFADARSYVPGAAEPALLAGSLDVAALERTRDGGAAFVPTLHHVLRRLYEAANAVHEGDHARRALLAAVERTLGADARLATDALRLVGTGPRLRGRLSIERGSDEGPFEMDEQEHKIGRSAANDIRIDHGSVSRRHARVVPRSGRFLLSDVGSTAGTRVDGRPLTGEHVLRGGESIALGDVVLRFEYVEA